MANVPAVPLSGRAARRGGLMAAPLLLALLPGCVLSDAFTHADKPPPPGTPCQLVCVWQNCVHYAPDPVRHGEPGPGLVARLYLFGPKLDFSMTAEGALIVDLYDETKGPPEMLERWEIDPETFKRLVKQDNFGWGYTLFLPWSKYSPAITKLRLRTGFKCAKAPAPIWTENVVTLAEGNGVLRQGTTPMNFVPTAAKR